MTSSLQQWYGKGWLPAGAAFAREDMGCDAFLCCPGPSLANVKDSELHGPGRMVFAINTAYPHIRPDVWIGVDTPDCYDKRIWSEPFTKIIRSGYQDERVSGKTLKEHPSVFVASLKKPEGDPFEFFRMRGDRVPLTWHSNTLCLALHVIAWMGARRIYLIGCDMGGSSDYHDGRVLTEQRRQENRKLYAQQVKMIRELVPILKEQGREIISCTDKSPLNEFLPYAPISAVLAHSMKSVPGPSKPVDVWESKLTAWEFLRHAEWKPLPADNAFPRAVMVGVIPKQEDLWPWWYSNFRKHNPDTPLVVADFGMSPVVKSDCIEKADMVIDMTDLPFAGWLRKPFSILRCPAKQILWLDLDTEVRGAVDVFWNFGQGKDVGVSTDLVINVRKPPHWFIRGHMDMTFYDTGNIACQHGNEMIAKWAKRIAEVPYDYWTGDHEALSVTCYDEHFWPRIYPNTLHRYAYEGATVPGLRIVHWCADGGKAHIRRMMQETVPDVSKLKTNIQGRTTCVKAVMDSVMAMNAPQIIEIGAMDENPVNMRSTPFLALLCRSRSGRMFSVDISVPVLTHAKEVCDGMNLPVEFVALGGIHFLEKFRGKIDVLFLDGPSSDNCDEWHRIAYGMASPWVAPGGLVVVDGENRWRKILVSSERDGFEILAQDDRQIVLRKKTLATNGTQAIVA